MKVSGDASIAQRVEQAFRAASEVTGTSFSYLVQTATKESSLEPTAKAKTSSAQGLFQFIESTWLETLHNNGKSLGLEDYSRHIRRQSDGGYTVDNPLLKQQILDLRTDPEISGLLAGALTNSNSRILSTELGREPSQGELYLAHFLGASGSMRLLGAVANTPDLEAASIFPSQAAANKSIFFASNGQARSVTDVYARLTGAFDEPAQTQVATSVPISKPQPQGDTPAKDVAHSRILMAWNTMEDHRDKPFELLFRNGESAALIQKQEAVSEATRGVFALQEVPSIPAPSPRDVPMPQPAPIGAPMDLMAFLNEDDDEKAG
ncbi:lytic transglycosylase domain-containing protein [Rhodobacteraceae bacterium RKSG542]|uniref:lytic transglycosylase domain-containing protein n=1 Tax=Pseudovibrio flavus TaxID=2529854 RepID=UPI0012BC1D68|nr:lytic transglycosylase domain-containing protein [Pseudovibrio flavus]MTI19377.1 lytic transglycosylase domain-containing protein [Pseudovibrio flavus]